MKSEFNSEKEVWEYKFSGGGEMRSRIWSTVSISELYICNSLGPFRYEHSPVSRYHPQPAEPRLSRPQLRWQEEDDPEYHLLDGRQEPVPGHRLHHRGLRLLLPGRRPAHHPPQVWQPQQQRRHFKLRRQPPSSSPLLHRTVILWHICRRSSRGQICRNHINFFSSQTWVQNCLTVADYLPKLI